MGGLLSLVHREGVWAGPQPAQTPLRCTKCHNPPISSQCTNHRIGVYAGHIGDMMGCDHLSFIPIGPLTGEL